MLFRVSAATLGSIGLFALLMLSGDFGIETVFSQTRSTSRELTTKERDLVNGFVRIQEGETIITIINNPTGTTLPDDASDVPVDIEDEAERDVVTPILSETFIDRVTNQIDELTKDDADTIVDTVFTLIDIADTIASSTEDNLKPQSTLSEECGALGARSRDECDKLLTIAFLPAICREQGIKTRDACDTYLVGSDRRPVECQNTTDTACRVLVEHNMVEAEEIKNTIESNVPEYCRIRDARTVSQCDKLRKNRLIPQHCRAAGATTQEQCATLLRADDLPERCRTAGILSRSACTHHLFLESIGEPDGSLEVPAICVDHNVTRVDTCVRAVQERVLHSLCKDAGIETLVSCNSFLIERGLETYCEDEGITDNSSCRMILAEELRNTVRCEGMKSDVCRDRAVRDHLGNWIEVKRELENRRRALVSLRNTASARRSELPADAALEIQKSIIDDRPLFLQATEEGVVINSRNELVALSPVAIVLDNDGDGLSNILEERIGTAPNDSDTDGDGFDDRTELREGFNPSGEGKKLLGLWPVDNAMIFGLPLEHPAASAAAVDDSFEIQLPKNSDTGEGVVFSGTATANTLATVFIYSPMPMVLTVETDSNGNWNYVLQESLTDGEHEVYVALVNDIGEIERQSSPLSFFIKEARAITIDEFFGVESAPPVIAEVPVDNLRTYYLIGAIALIVVVLIIVIIFILRARKIEDIPPPSDPNVT